MSSASPRIIESRSNPVFKGLKRLLSGHGIRKEGRTLFSGARLVGEAGSRYPERCEAWITTGRGMPAPPESLPHLMHYRLASDLFRELDMAGTRSPLLLVRPPAIESWLPQSGLPAGLTLFIPFQDPENVGAVIRSAAAFGVDGIVLLEESAHPYHPRAIRASGGTVLRVPLRAGPRLADLPPDLPLTPLSAEGKDIAGFSFPEPCGLLPGTEGEGLPPTWRKRAVAVPIDPGVESLNAAAAVAVALYVWSRSKGTR
jgi:tRNA G18 (ribose-2'-O)-methylase SpoU